MISVNKNIGNHRVTFSPSFYKRAWENFKNGSHRELISMMKEAETDTLIQGCLTSRKAGFMQHLSFRPFDQENQEDVDRIDFYRTIFRQLKERSLFTSIFNAKKYKFQVIDFDWEVRDGYQVPVRFKAFDQKYFRYDIKGDGKLKIDHGKDLEDIPETALVVENEQMPIMIPPLRDYILMEFGTEAWANFLETWSEPFIIGYYPPGSGDEIKNQLDEAVNLIGSSARGTAPKGTEIEVKETNRTTGDHDKFKTACEKGISIALLGHANAVMQSGAQIGENTAPLKPAENISIDDLYFIDEQIDNLIQIIHDRNFADQRYPMAVTSKPDQIGMKERRENLRLWHGMGFTIDPEEGKKLGIIVSPDDEPIKKQSMGQFEYETL